MDNELKVENEMDIDFDITDEDRKIKIEDEDGSINEYELIANVTTEDGSFVVYTDNKELENGQVALYVNSLIMEDDGSYSFDEVEDSEVQAIINEIRGRLS